MIFKMVLLMDSSLEQFLTSINICDTLNVLPIIWNKRAKTFVSKADHIKSKNRFLML